MTGWQDHWTFRIVDQDTGAAVPGVPVTVLAEGTGEGGHWMSDADGLVRIPKHDGPRLRLRVGLRAEDTIELDARALSDDPISLVAPRGVAPATDDPVLPERVTPATSVPGTRLPGHVVRFARIAVSPEDHDVFAAPEAERAATMRYGVLFEVEEVWQSLGPQAGDLLYSVSLGPGEEVKLAVADKRWRKTSDSRDRPVQIVSRMVAGRQLTDGVDAVPLEPCAATDLEQAAADTVKLLAERTVRASDSLRRRPLGVQELDGPVPAGSSVRTVRNLRSEGVLSYHVVEPVERYQVVVRTPRVRAALLVPFRLPNIATREVVRRYGHALKRAVLDRAYLPDVEHVLANDRPSETVEERLYAHITAHLPYYSATIIAAGDPAERFFALAKLKDAEGRPLTDVIENVVVGRVGNYVAFPLRSPGYAPERWRVLLDRDVVRKIRTFQELVVTLPVPGVWLRSELFPAQVANAAPAEEQADATRAERRRRG